jgi:transposase
MNILNLPYWEVFEVKEGEYDYVISARYLPEPIACARCGVIGQLYRHGVKRQRFMDLPIHGKRVGIIAYRQRYLCQACHKTSFQPLDDMDQKHAATVRLISFVGREAMRRTFVSVADDTGIHERTVRRLFTAEVARMESETKFETPRWLGIDEVHLVKRPRCILTNVEKHTVIDLLASRTKDVVSWYLYQLPERDKIELVAMDMWQPYRDAVKENLPQAVIVIDKFHIIRLAIQAMDQVRKETRSRLTPKQTRTLKRDRYILFHRANELESKDQFILDTWVGTFPLLGKAYQLKEEFCDLWLIQDRKEAQERFVAFLGHIPAELEAPFHPLITAMTNWKAEIFSYWDHPVTNAYTEALAGLVKIANRVGRGYSFQAIRAKILYSGLPVVRKPVFNRALEQRMPFVTAGEIKNYGVPLSTLSKMWELGLNYD